MTIDVAPISTTENLVEWLEEHRDSFVRLAPQIHPPRIGDLDLLPHWPRDLEGQAARTPQPKQLELIAAMRWMLAQGEPTLLCTKQGTGKTYMVAGAIKPFIEQRRAKGKTPLIVAVVPGNILSKWKREARLAMPDLQVLVAKSISDLTQVPEPSKRKSARNRNVRQDNVAFEAADFLLTNYTSLSNGAQSHPAAVRKPLVTKQWRWKDGVYREVLRGERNTRGLTYLLTCPQCGAPLMLKGKPMTATQLKREKYFCRAPLYRWVRDETSGTRSRKLDDGSLVWYRKERLTDRRGRARSCDTPLFCYHATPLEKPADWRLEPLGLPDQYDLVDGKSISVPVKRSGPRRWPLSKYLLKQVSKRRPLDLVIVDEVHMAKGGDTARGQAVGTVAGLAQHGLIAPTGTLSGGYASTLFYVLWRCSRAIRRDFGYREIGKWIERYGVLEYWRRQVEEGKERQEVKEQPGLLPAAYQYIWAHALFAELSEVFPNLPGFVDIVVSADLDETTVTTVENTVLLDEWGLPQRNEDGTKRYGTLELTQAGAYRMLKRAIETENRRMVSQGDRGFLGSMQQTLLRWPNACTTATRVINPRDGTEVIDLPALREDVLYPKEQALVDRVLEDLAAGRRALVYVNHVGKIDVAARLQAVLSQQMKADGRAVQARVLRSSTVPDDEREQWIEQQLAGGMDVLICNPGLVQVGMDLVAFPSIHVYQMVYSPYVLLQAVKRSIRYGQTEEVRVYYYNYRKTFETGALALMARKARTAALVAGSDIGEAFMTQAGELDMVTWMAQQLQAGLEGDLQEREVEAAFAQLRAAESEEEQRSLGTTLGTLFTAEGLGEEARAALESLGLLPVPETAVEATLEEVAIAPPEDELPPDEEDLDAMLAWLDRLIERDTNGRARAAAVDPRPDAASDVD